MKYNGFYFNLFSSPMKKVLTEKYGKEYTSSIMKKSKCLYKTLVEEANDIGSDTQWHATNFLLLYLSCHI